MDPEWISLIAAFGASSAAVLISANVRSILRTIFRRPRATSLIFEASDGEKVVLEVRGPGNLSPEQADALFKAWRDSAREAAQAGDTKASSSETAQHAEGTASDE